MSKFFVIHEQIHAAAMGDEDYMEIFLRAAPAMGMWN
jgi:hypothetical protein